MIRMIMIHHKIQDSNSDSSYQIKSAIVSVSVRLCLTDGTLPVTCQASNFEPDVREIQKYSVFLQAVASKRSALAGGGEEAVVLLKKVVHCWTQVTDRSLSLIGANRKCTDIVTSNIDDHLNSEGEKLLKAVVGYRKDIVRLMNTLEELKQENVSKVPPSLANLLSDTLPPAFETELQSVSFDDIVSRRAHILLLSLDQKRMEFQKALQAFYAEKKLEPDQDHMTNVASGWKATLEDSCSFDEILTCSQAIVESVPPKSLKPFSLAISQEIFFPLHCI